MSDDRSTHPSAAGRTERRGDNVLHLTPRRDGGSFALPMSRRIGSALLVNELRTPLAAVVRTLQRLSLQRIANEDEHEVGPDATALIRRARGLAAELQEVVDELLQVTAPEGEPTLRSHQETLPVPDVLQIVSSVVASYLAPERIVVDCAPDVLVTTHPGRLCELVVNVLAVANRHLDDEAVRIAVQPNAANVQIEIRWPGEALDDADDEEGDEGVGLPLARTLARSFGGSLGVAAAGGDTVVSVELPQQRARDRRPGRQSSRGGL